MTKRARIETESVKSAIDRTLIELEEHRREIVSIDTQLMALTTTLDETEIENQPGLVLEKDKIRAIIRRKTQLLEDLRVQYQAERNAIEVKAYNMAAKDKLGLYMDTLPHMLELLKRAEESIRLTNIQNHSARKIGGSPLFTRANKGQQALTIIFGSGIGNLTVTLVRALTRAYGDLEVRMILDAHSEGRDWKLLYDVVDSIVSEYYGLYSTQERMMEQYKLTQGIKAERQAVLDKERADRVAKLPKPIKPLVIASEAVVEAGEKHEDAVAAAKRLADIAAAEEMLKEHAEGSND